MAIGYGRLWVLFYDSMTLSMTRTRTRTLTKTWRMPAPEHSIVRFCIVIILDSRVYILHSNIDSI